MKKPYEGQLRFVERVEYFFQRSKLVKILQQYGETPRPDGYDGPTTHGWYDIHGVPAMEIARTALGSSKGKEV